MGEAITHTGPVLHLHEIGWLDALSIFSHLTMPDIVAKELSSFGLDPAHLGVTGLDTTVVAVDEEDWRSVISGTDQPTIHPADAQVFILSQMNQFQKPVLTDDLALRQRLESQGATAVGSVGVLVRAYTIGHFKRNKLENAVDALFTTSSLHMSHAFRAYVHHLVTNLP